MKKLNKNVKASLTGIGFAIVGFLIGKLFGIDVELSVFIAFIVSYEAQKIL